MHPKNIRDPERLFNLSITKTGSRLSDAFGRDDTLMIIIDCNKKNHKQIIDVCVKALKAGKTVVFPTDTSYGLAVDASNIKAIKKLYKVKGRSFNKAVSVVVPSVAYAKKIVKWGSMASKLAKKFWPGALTLVQECRIKNAECRILSAKSYFLGLRMPDNKIALDLAQTLKKSVTATSANVAGELDCYSVVDVISQFKNKKFKPDIIINTGKLPKRKPSTIVKINGNKLEVIRRGPISVKQILNQKS